MPVLLFSREAYNNIKIFPVYFCFLGCVAGFTFLSIEFVYIELASFIFWRLFWRVDSQQMSEAPPLSPCRKRDRSEAELSTPTLLEIGTELKRIHEKQQHHGESVVEEAAALLNRIGPLMTREWRMSCVDRHSVSHTLRFLRILLRWVAVSEPLIVQVLHFSLLLLPEMCSPSDALCPVALDCSCAALAQLAVASPSRFRSVATEVINGLLECLNYVFDSVGQAETPAVIELSISESAAPSTFEVRTFSEWLSCANAVIAILSALCASHLLKSIMYTQEALALTAFARVLLLVPPTTSPDTIAVQEKCVSLIASLLEGAALPLGVSLHVVELVSVLLQHVHMALKTAALTPAAKLETQKQIALCYKMLRSNHILVATASLFGGTESGSVREKDVIWTDLLDCVNAGALSSPLATELLELLKCAPVELCSSLLNPLLIIVFGEHVPFDTRRSAAQLVARPSNDLAAVKAAFRQKMSAQLTFSSRLQLVELFAMIISPSLIHADATQIVHDVLSCKNEKEIADTLKRIVELLVPIVKDGAPGELKTDIQRLLDVAQVPSSTVCKAVDMLGDDVTVCPRTFRGRCRCART